MNDARKGNGEMNGEPSTDYAPAGRCSGEDVARQGNIFRENALFDECMRYVPVMVMLLNSDRQIVYANRAVLDFAHALDISDIAGMRPGELLGCPHAREHRGGCGTSKYCKYCGAVNAILKSGDGRPTEEECRFTVKRGRYEEALDLRVRAQPCTIMDEPFTFLTVTNISDEKKNIFIEHVFLHEIMNTATALRGFSEILNGEALDDDTRSDFLRRMWFLSVRIADEIDAHRQLVAAENNELMLNVRRLHTKKIIEDVLGMYERGGIPGGKRLAMAEDSIDTTLETDPEILRRVIGNMVKNAMEASLPGETVGMGCRMEEGDVAFWAHNSVYIPENVRLRIFNRFFSTKGRGRGLGAYGMKYLTEKYLMGTVYFTSTEAGGTTFVVRYPKEFPKKMDMG